MESNEVEATPPRRILDPDPHQTEKESRMRSWKQWLAAPVAALVLATGAAAVTVTPAGAASPTIVGVLAGKSSLDGFDGNPYDYDILIKAVQTAGLVGALDDPAANLTVFAPDDAAFVRTARDLGFQGSSELDAWNFLVGAFTNLGKGDPIPVLTNVLLYHVANGRLGPLDVVFSKRITTLSGSSFGVRLVQLVDNAPKLPNPYLNVFALNQKASNGVIHGITRVLVPVDIP
jgi:serralysin